MRVVGVKPRQLLGKQQADRDKHGGESEGDADNPFQQRAQLGFFAFQFNQFDAAFAADFSRLFRFGDGYEAVVELDVRAETADADGDVLAFVFSDLQRNCTWKLVK